MKTDRMDLNDSPVSSSFGLLPDPERSRASFIASTIINSLILALLFIIGAMARQVVVEHHYENTELMVPITPPLPRVKLPPPPKIKAPEVEVQPAKIALPKPRPDVKQIVKPEQMEAKLKLPAIKAARPSVILARQPKPAMRAAMPAQSALVKPVARPVHLGDTFGVTPNPNATRPATVAAIGNPYGGLRGPAIAPQGVVRSAGIGNGLRSGSNAGTIGRVAYAGVPGGLGTANRGGYSGGGKVASGGILPTVVASAPVQQVAAEPSSTSLEIVSKPPVQYTSEARQMRIQGDVVLRVTFTAAGQVIVQDVLRGLGHGLDQEARRVAEQIRFRPATRNGRPTDLMTTITISFQLA
jgi:TonB family protein